MSTEQTTVAYTSIEKAEFAYFMGKINRGEFGNQRLGQAFWNHFSLHKMADQSALQNLYEKDGEEALNLIRDLFDFH